MVITLTSEQEAWIAAHVAAGDFASAEDAARQFIDESMAERDIETDDLDWARPFLDEARTSIARGACFTLEEHRARNAERIASLAK